MADGFEKIIARVEELKKKAAQAEGEAKQAMRAIKDEFGVETLVDAIKLLGKLQREENAAAKAYTEAMEAFMKKHGAQLEES